MEEMALLATLGIVAYARRADGTQRLDHAGSHASLALRLRFLIACPNLAAGGPLMRLLAAFALFVALAPWARANELEIVNIRVGQGDATLIEGPVDADGRRVRILFDTGDISGPDGGALIGALLAQRGVRELDYVIISHDDADHLGGMGQGGVHGSAFMLGPDGAPGSPGDDDGDGIGDWEGEDPFLVPDADELGAGDDVVVRTFVDYGDQLMRDTDIIAKYRGLAGAMGSRITIADQDDVDSFEIDLGGGARMIAMAANGYVRGRGERVARVNTPNERSLSFLVRYGGFDYLISGDLIGRRAGREDAEVELAVGEALAGLGYEIDVLHVNHHGADNTSESRFLELIRPEIAIISAGNGNSHGHPAAGSLRRLADAGVYRIIQTEWGATRGSVPAYVRARQAIYQDDIVIRSDGARYEISTSRTFAVDEE